MSADNTMSRRRAIGSMGAVLATAAISPVVAKGFTDTDITSVPALEDPTTKYVRPPFKEQSQPWPGLAGKMDPKPDHGEKTYKGSGRLKGVRRCLQEAIREWVGQRP